MSVITVVETTNNSILEPKGNSALRVSSAGVLWLEPSATSGDQYPETKVTGSQYLDITLEGDLELVPSRKMLELIQMSNRQIPTLFVLCGITFFAISAYFLFQSVFDLGVASLGPGVTAVLAAIFAKMVGGTKK